MSPHKAAPPVPSLPYPSVDTRLSVCPYVTHMTPPWIHIWFVVETFVRYKQICEEKQIKTWALVELSNQYNKWLKLFF